MLIQNCDYDRALRVARTYVGLAHEEGGPVAGVALLTYLFETLRNYKRTVAYNVGEALSPSLFSSESLVIPTTMFKAFPKPSAKGEVRSRLRLLAFLSDHMSTITNISARS